MAVVRERGEGVGGEGTRGKAGEEGLTGCENRGRLMLWHTCTYHSMRLHGTATQFWPHSTFSLSLIPPLTPYPAHA